MTFSSPEDAKNLKASMKNNGMVFFPSSDGAKEFGVTVRSSQFVELTVDQTATPLAEKPNCDNYGKCPTPPTP